MLVADLTLTGRGFAVRAANLVKNGQRAAEEAMSSQPLDHSRIPLRGRVNGRTRRTISHGALCMKDKLVGGPMVRGQPAHVMILIWRSDIDRGLGALC